MLISNLHRFISVALEWLYDNRLYDKGATITEGTNAQFGYLLPLIYSGDTVRLNVFFYCNHANNTQDPWLNFLDNTLLREHHDKLAHAYAQFCRLVEETPSMPQSRSSQFFDGKTL